MIQGPALTGGLDSTVDAACLPDCDILPVVGDNRQLRPEEKFLCAIIEGAIADYLGPRQRRSRPRGRRTSLQMEAEVWFTSGSHDFLSFRWMCSVLGLDPDYLWGRRDDWQVKNHSVGTRHRVRGPRREAA